MPSILEAAERALAASDSGPADEATVAAMLTLAAKIDHSGEKTDRVVFSTFLNYCEALHLTPASRERLPKGEEKPVDLVDDLKARRAKKRSA